VGAFGGPLAIPAAAIGAAIGGSIGATVGVRFLFPLRFSTYLCFFSNYNWLGRYRGNSGFQDEV